MLFKYMENVLYKYTCLTVFVFFFLPNKSAFQMTREDEVDYQI